MYIEKLTDRLILIIDIIISTTPTHSVCTSACIYTYIIHIYTLIKHSCENYYHIQYKESLAFYENLHSKYQNLHYIFIHGKTFTDD